MYQTPLQLPVNNKTSFLLVLSLTIFPYGIFTNILLDVYIINPYVPLVLGEHYLAEYPYLLSVFIKKIPEVLIPLTLIILLHSGGILRVSTTAASFRWKHMFISLIVAFLSWGLILHHDATLNLSAFSSDILLITIVNICIAILLALVLSGWWEEFLYSAYFLRQSQEHFRLPLAVAACVVVVLFTFAHSDAIIENPVLIVYYPVPMIVSLILVWKTKGIEASVGLHAGHNLVTFGVIDAKLFDSTTQISQAHTLDFSLLIAFFGSIFLYELFILLVVSWLLGDRVTFQDIRKFFTFNINSSQVN